MTSLAEEFPKEQERVREVLLVYESLRGCEPQIFVEPAIIAIKATLKEAELAAASGDVIAMTCAFRELRCINL